MSYRKSIAWR